VHGVRSSNLGIPQSVACHVESFVLVISGREFQSAVAIREYRAKVDLGENEEVGPPEHQLHPATGFLLNDRQGGIVLVQNVCHCEDMKTPYQKRPLARFLNSVCFAALLGPALTGGAQTQTFTDRATWDAYVAATPTNIDFTTRDDGSLITNPAQDVGMSLLSLRCVEFLNVRSYWDASIYVFPAQVLRVNLPAGTFAFGTDLIPFYGLSGTGSIILSTGESFVYSPGFVPWTWDFFGVHSSEIISWVEFKYDNDYLALDNFSYLPGTFVPGQPCPTSIGMTIDIKPDSSANPVNPKSNGMLPVVVFGSPGLDTSQIDVGSLRLGVTGVEAPPHKNRFFQDVNWDGDTDLVLDFRIPDTGMTCTTNQLLMTGQLLSGLPIAGSDVVKPVGCQP